MKRYHNYKSSGIEWLGDVPEHWELKKLKYTAEINPSKSAVLAGVDEEQPVTFLPMEKVSENGTVDTDLKKPIKELLSGFTFFQERDVIVAKITPCFENGKGAYLENLDSPFGFGSTEFHVLRGHDQVLLNEFLYYVTKSNLFMELGEGSMAGAGGQKRVPTSFLQDFLIAYPATLNEQIIIVDFIKDKTSQINTLIQKKQRMIALLEEERAAVINEAVTKGLNPDVPMKDSGIEWLGMVPAHWEVVRLTKYLESIIDYRGRTPEKTDSGVFLVTARNIKGGIINYGLSSEYVSAEESEQFMKRGSVEVGDVLFTTEAPLGEVANVDRTDICLAQRVIKFRAKANALSNYFLKHWMQSHSFQNDLQSHATGSTARGIKASKLNYLFLVLPPLNEQSLIVSHIEKAVRNLGNTSNQINKEIHLLQEYRTALISEAVTGKIDVRDYQPEPLTSPAFA